MRVHSDMNRATASTLLTVLGVVLLVFALLIEVDIHSRLESSHMAGFRRFVVRRWPDKRDMLRHYRYFARICAVAGPIALAGAYVIALGGKKPDLSAKKQA